MTALMQRALGGSASIGRQIGRAAVIAAAASLASCQKSGVLDPQGPVANAQLLLLFNATAIMLVVVGPVIVLTLGFAWWYRASNARASYAPDWDYSGQIELVVWSIPAMIVILVAGVGWIGAHQLDPAKKLETDVPPLRVQVVSLDWKWLFLYPDHKVATVNQLMVPAGAPIEFELTSATVMNAFFVPQLGSQIYTMPGMTTRLHLLADRPGDYPGLSSHFSGDGFSDMRFLVHALPAPEFEAWVKRIAAEGAVLEVAELAQRGTATPSVYRQDDATLFDQILHQSTQPSGAHH